MLKLKGYDKNKNEIDLPGFTGLEISMEEGVPADSLEAVFPYFQMAEQLCFVCLYRDGALLFEGLCDEIAHSKSNSGVYTYVYCRNMFALLIDNEACPGVYRNITAGVVFDRYLKPLGFTDFIADGGAVEGEFTVSKGQSVYEVLREFCRIRYNSVPLPGKSGEILFNPVQQEKGVVFSDVKIPGERTVNYSELEISLLPCKLISRVNVKTSENDYYTTLLHNSFAEEKGVVRQRYMDACSTDTPLNCGYTLLENSNKRYGEYSLKIPGCCDAAVGEGAQIRDTLFSAREELYIYSIRYTAGRDGDCTYITLKRKC